ncbi:LysR family transcriptional regulator [Testudinibacter aquarius]|uniref:LysR family transcriptional regulator n=2 Tax=Testudinibacter aquarius TaxID=1524974 RepID=A0A4R3YB66_9PAST|nr:LysR family transcriptional regulator [Testudinibacter aquarius]KAE9528978.1 LysR family transcriptional regulator [Testudinibacter aquarius]TCV89257.1 LysR family transcriptional regulator [Testudinibacter aquarius]TNG93375.1 LysR family transcriptional regulator [Testudinibacter aquarius]
MHSAIYGQLTVFHTIAAQGSISTAARQLEIGAPAVSKSLKQLEEHIGLPLFNRTTRKLELTEAGSLLLARTGEAVQSLQYAVESVHDLGQTPAGRVRITVPRIAYLLVLKPHFAEFCRRYPQVELEISMYDGTVDIIKEGFDLGIRFGHAIEENRVARKLLPPFRGGLYVSKAYADQFGVPQSLAELAQHKLIGFRFMTANSLFPLSLHENGHEVNIEMPTPLIVNSLEVVLDAVRQGLGIGRVFEPILALEADAADFIPVLERHWKHYPPLSLYYPQHSQKAKRIRVLIDFLAEKMASV